MTSLASVSSPAALPCHLADCQFDVQVRQIIVGSVDPDRHPAEGVLPAELGHLDFVGAKCSVTLVEGGHVKLLVDCASPFEERELLAALQARGIDSPSAITHLAVSHWHSDHCGLVHLFPDAKLITPEMVKLLGPQSLGQHLGLPPAISLSVYVGHSTADLVIRVRQKSVEKDERGKQSGRTIAIVGDLFECENDWTRDEPWKGISLLPDRQTLARWMCWQGADLIVPGHGPAFATAGRALSTASPLFGKLLFHSDISPLKNISTRERDESVCFEELFLFREGNTLFRSYLVQSRQYNFLVNTGGPAQRASLEHALQSRGIPPQSIHIVIISSPGQQFCANIGLFPNSIFFLCHDISVPGCFYAKLDHPFVSFAGGSVSIWRDLNTEGGDQCTLAVLLRTRGVWSLIGQKLDKFLLAQLGVDEKQIRLSRVIEAAHGDI